MAAAAVAALWQHGVCSVLEGCLCCEAVSHLVPTAVALLRFVCAWFVTLRMQVGLVYGASVHAVH
jgi:hypothetical protein